MSRRKLYIGAEFVEEGICYEDGSALPQGTYAVLHCLSDRKFYKGEPEIASGKLNVTFASEVTAAMKPGMYDLELYTDNSMTEVIWVEHEYAEAVRIAKTAGETDATPAQS